MAGRHSAILVCFLTACLPAGCGPDDRDTTPEVEPLESQLPARESRARPPLKPRAVAMRAALTANGGTRAVIGKDGPLLLTAVVNCSEGIGHCPAEMDSVRFTLQPENGPERPLTVQRLSHGAQAQSPATGAVAISWQASTLPAPGRYKIRIDPANLLPDKTKRMNGVTLTVSEHATPALLRGRLSRRIQRLQGQRDAVIADLEERIAAGHPNTPAYLLEIAGDYTAAGRWEDARDSLYRVAEQIERLDKPNNTVHDWLYLRLERLKPQEGAGSEPASTPTGGEPDDVGPAM